MFSRTSILLSVVLAVSAGGAFADTVVGTAGNTWQTFPATLNTSDTNRPFWDQGSMDGTNRNIGDLLKSGTITGAAATPDWWGNNGPWSSNFDPSFSFDRTASSSNGLLKLELAGHANVNAVGWYDTTKPAVLHQLWAGSASSTADAAIVFSPTASYGFYIVGTNGTFYTEASLNSAATETSYQHFALFADSLTPGNESYWIGVEDMPA